MGFGMWRKLIDGHLPYSPKNKHGMGLIPTPHRQIGLPQNRELLDKAQYWSTMNAAGLSEYAQNSKGYLTRSQRGQEYNPRRRVQFE
jgi:hypothetical protein